MIRTFSFMLLVAMAVMSACVNSNQDALPKEPLSDKLVSPPPPPAPNNAGQTTMQRKLLSENSQDSWILRFDGIGPVKIGMSLSELKNILHNDAKEEASGNESCFYISTSKHPHVGFMIIDDHVVRIDVTQRGVPTVEGIQVGNFESKVKLSHPQVTIEPHAYTPEGKYLTVKSDDGRFGLRFETDKGRITGFYAGKLDAIHYIEGCD